MKLTSCDINSSICFLFFSFGKSLNVWKIINPIAKLAKMIPIDEILLAITMTVPHSHSSVISIHIDYESLMKINLFSCSIKKSNKGYFYLDCPLVHDIKLYTVIHSFYNLFSISRAMRIIFCLLIKTAGFGSPIFTFPPPIPLQVLHKLKNIDHNKVITLDRK